VATAHEIPPLVSLYPDKVTPSPWTALGAKGISEGNTTSTPVCVANAVADALGRNDIRLPLIPHRVADWIFGAETPPRKITEAPGLDGRTLSGRGSTMVPEPPDRVWQMLLEPEVLAKIIPGCHHLSIAGPNAYRATVTLGAGPVRGRFDAEIKLTDLQHARAATLQGQVSGPFGIGHGLGHIHLSDESGRTRLEYDYKITMTGMIAAIGGRMVDGVARATIQLFFQRLVREASRPRRSDAPWWRRLFSQAADGRGVPT
jgi:2-furoyl-CoA dehydrogenase large subunit